ncbi:MarC family protein [Pelomicrobium sp.]|jgi:multiple antibiotic resistance protein|uniref:MarC family protein n=1 Tax=Pelomicrobium sp. TaxID=2815319 RepID=UPI002FDC8D04
MEGLASWTDYTRFLVTLTAVLDPFFIVPFFLAFTAGWKPRERRRLARVVTLTVAAVLMGFALAGEAVLQFLGGSLASFRVGGGLVLLLMALAMLNAEPGGIRQSQKEALEFDAHATGGVVPLAIPLLAGPGAISTVIIAVERGGLAHTLAILGCILAVCALLWAVLQLAVPLGQRLGTTGLNVATRLLGLLLTAIAVETMAVGLKALFPGWAG